MSRLDLEVERRGEVFGDFGDRVAVRCDEEVRDGTEAIKMKTDELCETGGTHKSMIRAEKISRRIGLQGPVVINTGPQSQPSAHKRVSSSRSDSID